MSWKSGFSLEKTAPENFIIETTSYDNIQIGWRCSIEF